MKNHAKVGVNSRNCTRIFQIKNRSGQSDTDGHAPTLSVMYHERHRNGIECSVEFSEDEQAIIEQYALLHDMKASEVIRKATLEMIEDETDVQAFREAKLRFDKGPVTHTHKDVGKELGFL